MPFVYVILAYFVVFSTVHGEEGGRKAHSSVSVSLATSEECADDVKLLHCNVPGGFDFDVIKCLQADEATLNAVSDQCQHAMWKRKLELTTKRAFDSSIPKSCVSEFTNISECSQEQDSSFYVPCLVMHKDKVNNKMCYSFLNSVAALIFSDFRLFHKFIKSCNADIERYHCGRIDVGPTSPKEELRHLAIETQGKTLHCLQGRVEKLESSCRQQILRIGELQSDDYHLDRPLYFACHEDRERLCSAVNSGEGRVYSCLWQHKTAPEMSAACQQILTERQKLRSIDYRIGFRFTEACKSDIQKWSCSSSRDEADSPSLSHVMLCLEAVEKPHVDEDKQGAGVGAISQHHSPVRRLEPECRAELLQIRKEMLEDYRLSPDIIFHCEPIIEKYCPNAKEDPSSVLHCLINLMRHSSRLVERPSETCVASVQALIKVSDVESNVRLDPVIERACHGVLTAKCSDQHEMSGGAFECLLNHEHDPETTPVCRRHIHELYYFISRDVTLDKPFLDSCAVDAHRYCGLQEKYWTITGDSAHHPHLLTCLYNHRMPRKLENGTLVPGLSGSCRVQVHRLMVARASSVSLDPEVFEVCLADLAIYCQDESEEDDQEELEKDIEGQALQPEKKKSGLACLQDNFNNLRQICRSAVVKATANAVEDPNLDKLVSMACTSAEHELCGGHDDPKETFRCLIDHKNDPKMPRACRLAVEHLQRTALGNIHISKDFLGGCRGDIELLCNASMLVSKSAVITCLSSRMTVQAVMQEMLDSKDSNNNAYRGLSDSCREQMSLELLQRSESIELDPELRDACQSDAQRLCVHVKSGAGRIISCLRHHRGSLSTACHTRLFQREEVMAAGHQLDYPLLTACRQMISVYCAPVAARAMEGGASLDSDSDDVVECLANAMQRFENRHHFDPVCRRELVNTLSLRSTDYRLDLPLLKACRHDITKYCREDAARADASQYEDNGSVLHCLKKHFVTTDPEKALTPRCYYRVRTIIALEHVFYRLDPVLVNACKTDIMQQCRAHLMNATRHIEQGKPTFAGDGTDSDSEEEDDDDLLESGVRECLRDALQHNRLKSPECVQEMGLTVREEITDILLDPHLAQACTVEVRTHCDQVTPGEGQLMTCLLRLLDRSDASSLLGRNCYRQLLARRELWQRVSLQKDPDSLVDIVHQINSGSLRNAFLLTVFIILSLIFLVGIFCGRATKRIPLELKTR